MEKQLYLLCGKNKLAAADGHDNFYYIAVSQLLVTEYAARYDFPVSFQGQSLALELKLFQQLQNR